MNAVLNMSRRRFLTTSALAGGGLILGVFVPRLGRASEPEMADGHGAADPFAPNAFVRIASDGTVTIIANHSEMGQGIYTGLALIVAEELDADWATVRVEGAPVDPVYNHVAFGMQATGGSTSTWTEWERLRTAGASARAMLVGAAAAQWGIDAAGCRTEKGHVVHPISGEKLSYGGLVGAAAAQPVPENVPLKDPAKFALIGKNTPRLDTPAKTNGSAQFGIDVTVPGMLVAVVARPPVFGGTLVSFDDTKAKAIPGVRHVVAIDRGVAVVADGFWPAKLGRDALAIEWDDGPLGTLDSVAQRAQYLELARRPGAVVARAEGDPDAAFAGAARTLDATFEVPYLAHAPMEPLNAVADVRADGCDIWTGTQFQTVERGVAAQITGLPPESIKVHTTFLGGGFGRRAVFDAHFTAEAVALSKAVGAPVKCLWTREDDIRGGYYRPSATHVVRAALDEAGNPVAWTQRIVVQSFFLGTPWEQVFVKNGLDEIAVEGAAEIPYAIPSLRVDWQPAPGGVPTLWWRSVGHTHTAFVVESMIDDLAHAAGKDAFEYRRVLLAGHPRTRRVLELAAEKAGWGTPLPSGRARGIAVHESFGSYVAHVAEVSESKEGRPRVHRVVCAIDCGPVVNPDQVHAQMESCVVYALTATLFGEVSFAKGRVRQRNFHDYPMLRINEMPEVEVHIVPSTDKMGGVGEPGVPPVAPAVCNALFALNGKRVRRLPILPEGVRRT